MGRRCSEREMQSPDFIGLLGVMQAWGTRRRCVRALEPESTMSLFSTALNSDSKIKISSLLIAIHVPY